LMKNENSLGLNVFDILENKLEVYKSLISQLKNAGEKINNNTISEAELEELRNSYNEFTNFKNGLMNFLGQS
ncbi:MAG: hypothetical protein KC414_10530, partial [Romboutsia sp.]|nr:hypothetical protein [Romboutsia sp.]